MQCHCCPQPPFPTATPVAASSMNRVRNRLSLAFSSSATNTGGKSESGATKTSAQHYTIPTTNCRQSKYVPTLQEDFDSTIPAEAPTEPYLIKESEYPSIRALRTDADIGDGIWICCHCRHENILTHCKGTFPFKYLCCNRCNRTLCSDCHTSEILSPIPYGMINAARPAGGREIRYCHVCTHCGLSHRAVMEGTTLDFYGVTCAGCGLSSFGDWPRYYIGNNEPYRRDPDTSFVKLVDRRAEDAARLACRWVIANADSRPTSSLSCTNLG